MLHIEDMRFSVVIRRVELAKITTSVLTFDKRVDSDTGKQYTPPMLSVVCDVGTLVFDIERATIVQQTSAVSVYSSPDYKVVFSLEGE